MSPLFDPDQIAAAESLLALYRQHGKMIATAESCTGGLVAACLTEIAGSSDVVERGFVTYSNEAKAELLGVPADLIASVGAVSAEVAKAMAAGAVAHSRADVAVSVTGVAGPGGGSAEKPVGLVHFGLCRRDAAPNSNQRIFPGDRAAVREASLRHALAMLRGALD